MQTTRMNHSCRPNTRVLLIKDDQDEFKFFVRTIANIKAGEEITYSYDEEKLSMKNRETRQKFLWEEKNFFCICNFCKYGKEDQEVITAFRKLSEELKNLGESSADMMKRVKCIKDMYNLAKNNRTSWNFTLTYLYGLLLGRFMNAFNGISCVF